jgi:hypothetical protein
MADTEARSLSIKRWPRGESLSMHERGHIKIGQRGEARPTQGGGTFRLPEKLDHFIITTMERVGPAKDDNFVRDEALEKKIMERTGQTKLTRIPVVLLKNERDLNFQSQLVAYAGTKKWCYGDGITAHRQTQSGNDKDGVAIYEYKPIACPCPHLDPTFQTNKRCKYNGVLSVLIRGAGTVGGVWKFRTTSFNSVMNITEALDFIWNGTDGVLKGIPMVLTMGPRSTTNPVDSKPVTIYTVGLEFDGASLDELTELGYQKRAAVLANSKRNRALDQEQRRFLAAPVGDAVFPGETAKEIVEEFYPEQQIADGDTIIDADGVVSPSPANGNGAAKTPSKLDRLPTLQQDDRPPPDMIEELTGRRTDPKIGLQESGTKGPDAGTAADHKAAVHISDAPAKAVVAGAPTYQIHAPSLFKLLRGKADACKNEQELIALRSSDDMATLNRVDPELYDLAREHIRERLAGGTGS